MKRQTGGAYNPDCLPVMLSISILKTAVAFTVATAIS
jgi:hypothetical protein